MNYETIILERKDGIGYLTLNRPERANTISLQLMIDVVNAMEEVDKDPESRVVILTGAGGKHFLRRRRPAGLCRTRAAARVVGSQVQAEETSSRRSATCSPRSRKRAFRSSPRSTAPRWGEDARSRWPAIFASSPTLRA